MKRRIAAQASATAEDPLDLLCGAFLAVQSGAEMRAFLQDLCTPAELEALSDRWRVVPLLLAQLPYREIHDRTAVSTTTIGRVARSLVQGHGGYRAAAGHLGMAVDGVPPTGADGADEPDVDAGRHVTDARSGAQP